METFHLHSQYVPLQDCSLSLDKNSGSSSGYPSSPHSGLAAGRIRRQRWKIFWKCFLGSGEMLSLFKMKLEEEKNRNRSQKVKGGGRNADNGCNNVSFDF